MSKIFAIKDLQADVFTRPFIFIEDGAAKRALMHAVSGADNAMSDNPDDYNLYYLGEYDDRTGIIIPDDPKRIWTGAEALAEGRRVKFRREKLIEDTDNAN